HAGATAWIEHKDHGRELAAEIFSHLDLNDGCVGSCRFFVDVGRENPADEPKARLLRRRNLFPGRLWPSDGARLRGKRNPGQQRNEQRNAGESRPPPARSPAACMVRASSISASAGRYSSGIPLRNSGQYFFQLPRISAARAEPVKRAWREIRRCSRSSSL